MTENMKNKDVTSLVSVVVPIYNVESYLKECVDSILFQTYKNIEVILVDDESPDSCGKMCDDYEKMDTRIKVVHKKNGGLSDARNAGMKVATGDLITFVDSDDYISKDFIEILFEAMLENKSDIAIANMKRTSKRDEKNTSTAWKTSNFKSEDALISMLYGIPFGTSACGKLFKRNLFKGVEFPYGKFSEDLFTIYKTILKSKSVTYVEFDGYFYYYRDEGSIVVSGYKEKHLEALDAVDDIAGAVKGKTQFDNAYTVFALHNCTHYYYESQGNEHQTIPHNHFEDMEWHIRLVLEGEDRLVRNLEARESETFSYAADVNPEYNNEMEDPRINVMDFVLNKEFLRKASELLKKHQWEMICRHYIEGMTHREIAAEMGVSHQYVTKGIKKGLHRIRCTYT